MRGLQHGGKRLAVALKKYSKSLLSLVSLRLAGAYYILLYLA